MANFRGVVHEFGLLVREFTGAALGLQTYQVDFRRLPKEHLGRPLHIAGIEIRAAVELDTVAATMPAAMPYEFVAACIDRVSLKVGEHDYLDGSMNGREVNLCSSRRLGRRFLAPERLSQIPTSVPDADAAGVQRPAFVYIAAHRPTEKGSARYDGVIPVACFHGDENGGNFLEFTVRPSCDGFPGVTVASVTTLEVWVHLVALDDVRISPWAWLRRETNEPHFEHAPVGGIESLAFASVNHATPTYSHFNYQRLRLAIDGRDVYSGLDALELAYNHDMLQRANQLGLTPGASLDWLDIIASDVSHRRTKLPRGRVRVEWDDSAIPFSTTRVLIMQTGLWLPRTFAALALAAGAPRNPRAPNEADAVMEAAVDTKPTTTGAGVLDAKLFWAGMPYTITQAKAEKRGA